jgi:hypothetical protein
MKNQVENNISNVKGTLFKKWLGADTASLLYKNQSKPGGNFGMEMYFGHYITMQLDGYWNTYGELKRLSLQVNWGRSGNYKLKNLQELGDLAPQILKNLQEKKNDN